MGCDRSGPGPGGPLARQTQQGSASTEPAGVRAVRSCRVCGAEDWQQVVSLGEVPLANRFRSLSDRHISEARFPLCVQSCRSCRLMSLSHVVDPELLYRSYLYTTPQSAVLHEHLAMIALEYGRMLDPAGGDLVVEIGSNTGDQLLMFTEAGHRVLGVDPAQNFIAIAAARGVPTIPEFFTREVAKSIKTQHGAARLIIARHVLAHIDNLADTLAGVRELLAHDGAMLIEVPYLVDLLNSVAFDTIYHEHLSYFSVHTLVELFRRHGLRVIDVRNAPVHGGSIMISVVRLDSSIRARSAVSRALTEERTRRLHDDETYVRFATETRRLISAISSAVSQANEAGLAIAGYGAPAKGITLLNVCGIDASHLTYCIDSTKLKQGMLLPGADIPVHDPEFAIKHPPDLYLLLAWTYAEEILARERAFMANGGRFLIPIPHCQIVPGEDGSCTVSTVGRRVATRGPGT